MRDRFNEIVRIILKLPIEVHDINLNERPIILISACVDKKNTGDFIYNGGIKLFNLWAKLLRSKGFLAYLVTYDGKYQPWMIDHQPCISLELASKWKKQGKNLRFVTTWLAATEFNNLADKIYFHDCEPHYSFGIHYSLLKKFLAKNKLVLSTETRTEQAYFRSKLGIDTCLIPPYLDTDFFFPDSDRRVSNRIGFVVESKNTIPQIIKISKELQKNNISAEMVNVKGVERDFVNLLQSCDLYLGLNPGKDSFHSEGLARTHLEALGCGSVVVAFDVGGNREFLFDGFNSFISPNGNTDMLINKLSFLLRNPQQKELLRKNAEIFLKSAFTHERTWPALKKFLGLDNFSDLAFHPNQFDRILNKQELEIVLGGPAYLHEDELPVFKKYTKEANNVIIEIGAGYGASALMFLLNKNKNTKLYSIDKFTMADKTKPPRGAKNPPEAVRCQANIEQGLSVVGKVELFEDWQLLENDSHSVSQEWKKEINLLFIDGDHSYNGVKQDFNDWFPFVKAGGIIFLHDSRRLKCSYINKFSRGWQGPTKLAEELKKRKDIRLIDKAFSLTVWKKL